jgi:hypothetical protein
MSTYLLGYYLGGPIVIWDDHEVVQVHKEAMLFLWVMMV